ncbi:uncharacterized protein TRIADDRAFT_56571 [Trichoplax adhaerens]|uniref:BHLH domain-containing protein n=1 Tax=Trichoplax adhaerens TaxID=10228 RepID=B3RYI5_TRIAD|nr:hypothetical protein TRIADDRAFT_56571 [Trichoplax adhaerens]EDV24603.1 hypothetical protein TRIADDRAFT_56571 [Trichoplax adhaerens]|eukprot:XP_002112493.1 hypothetical protein TRIADDRAFT_56571 [Trichoplax adhaerens]
MDMTLNTDIDVVDQFVIFSFFSQDELNSFTTLQQSHFNGAFPNTRPIQNIVGSDSDISTTKDTPEKIQSTSSSQDFTPKSSPTNRDEVEVKRNCQTEVTSTEPDEPIQSFTSDALSTDSVNHHNKVDALHSCSRKSKKASKRKLQAHLSDDDTSNTASSSVTNSTNNIHDVRRRKYRENEFKKKQDRPNALLGTCMQSIPDVKFPVPKSPPIKRWCVTCPEEQWLHERRKDSNIRLRFQADYRHNDKDGNPARNNKTKIEQSDQSDLKKAGNNRGQTLELHGKGQHNWRLDRTDRRAGCKVKIIHDNRTRGSNEILNISDRQYLATPTSLDEITDFDGDSSNVNDSFYYSNSSSAEEGEVSADDKTLKFHTPQMIAMKSLYHENTDIIHTSDTDASDWNRKVTHNKKERERRSKQKVQFFRLQQSHPDLVRLEKCPKIKILQSAINLIHNLYDEEQRLVNIKMILRDKNGRLKNKLQTLRQAVDMGRKERYGIR